MADVKELNINNTTYDIKAKSVVDQNGGKLRFWTGTRTQYDAITTKDSNTLYWLIDAKIIYLGDTAVGNFSSGRNVGEIITSTLPLTDAGLHLLDGSLLQYGIYKDFIDYIAELHTSNPNANYFCTETEWQNSVTTYGSCGKFVYDSTLNTVRLPKVSDILQGTTDVSALGDLVEAGLPNITGTVRWAHAFVASANGAYSAGANTTEYFGGTAETHPNNLNFNASRSSSIYGNSSTVQPQTIKVLYYIVIANSTKTDIQVDIDEVVTDLNGKADTDLSNTTDSAKVMMSSMGMPSDKYIDLTLGASGATYIAPANGWFFVDKIANSSLVSDFKYITLRNNASKFQFQNNGAYQFALSAFIPVKKGDEVQVSYNATGNVNAFKFIYAVGSTGEE